MRRTDITPEQPVLVDVVAEPVVPPAQVRRTRMKLLRHMSPMSKIGLVVVGVIVLLALAAPLLAPFDPLAPSASRLAGPSGTHLFGTDLYGRDVLSRMLVGARVSVMVGFVVTLSALVIGGTLGCVAGFVGGVADAVVSRITEVLLAVPGVLLAIAIVATLGSGVWNVCIALTLGQAPIMIRVVRSSTLALRERPFVRAAHAVGATRLRILFRHIAPYVLGVAAVQGTFVFAHAILYEAALSFLGIGVKPPDPTWGNMISESRAFLSVQPWNAIFPGLAITLLVLGVNFLGDGLRDLVDPENQERS